MASRKTHEQFLKDLFNKNGKKPHTLDVITDDEVLSALKTIVSLCENKNIDISDLLNKHKAS